MYRNYTWGQNHNLTWSSNDTSTGPQKLFHLATYDLPEIVENITVHLSEKNRNGAREIQIDLDERSGEFKEVRHRNFGRCYTFQPDKNKRMFGVNFIKAYL